MSFRRVKVKDLEMSPEMLEDAVQCACEAQEKYSEPKDIAKHIKHEFDQKYGTFWHCVVGRSFSSYISYESDHFIYFYLGPLAILLFKSA